MKISPSLCLPVSPRQTPTSYASQMGMRVGRSARDFCLDQGFNFQGVVDGSPTAIQALTETCWLEAGVFDKSTILKVSDRRYEIAGQALTRDALSRARVRVCPACIREDLEGANQASGIFGRIEWQVASIRTCPRHHTKLVVVSTDKRPSRTHDFAWHMKGVLSNPASLKEMTEDCSPTSLELHLLALLDGTCSENLMGLPFYAVSKLSDIVGAMIRSGKYTAWNTLDDEEWREAGALGFEVISAGWSGLADFLTIQQDQHVADRKNWGPGTVFGRLYEFLAHESNDEGYDPLRSLMFDHVCAAMPVGPGDHVFNRPVKERKLHSVRSAAIEFGIQPKRLTKLLHANGIIDDDDLSKRPDHVVVAVEDMKKFLALQHGTMSLLEVRDYLNMPRPHDEILKNAGLLIPAFEKGKSRGDAYARADLDKFLALLTRRAVPLAAGEGEFHWIGGATKRASCSVIEIVQLLIDDKLERVRLDPNARGYKSILLDPKEIGPLVKWADSGGISLRDAEKLLFSSHKVVKALIDGRHLSSFVALNPVKRVPTTYVVPGEIDRFLATYASLSHLERETSIHFMKIARALRTANIATAFHPDEVHATFYRRDDVAEPLAQLRDQIVLVDPE